MVLTDETKEVIHRSVVRPAADDENPNKRLFPDGGETDTSAKTETVTEKDKENENGKCDDTLILQSYADVIDPPDLKLPTIDPIDIIGKTFLLPSDADGETHRAEVVKELEKVDGETQQHLVRLGDGKREDVMTCNAVVEAIDRQIERENAMSDEERLWIHKEVKAHRKMKNGQAWEVLMQWEDDSKTWEPLTEIAKTDPVHLAKHAKENGLLDLPGWKRLHTHAKREKKLNQILHQARINTMKTGIRIKFGVRIPRDFQEALQFDELNGNTLWQDANKTELEKLHEYDSFESKGKGTVTPDGHKKIRCHMIFDVKQDGRRRARFVAGGHMTGVNDDTCYSSVVSLRGMRMVVFLAELNGLELAAGDIGSACLEAFTREKVCFVAGKEFAPFGHKGHTMVVIKALHGLETSGARFHELLAESLEQLGFHMSKADSDIWMKDCGSHYEYVCTWADDVLHAGRNSKEFYDGLRKIGFVLKPEEEPSHHLGGDFKRVKEPEIMLTWGSLTYVKWMLVNCKVLFGVEVPKSEIHAPLESGDHPELDDSPLLGAQDIRNYWQMIGELQWAVALGRIDICYAVMTMSRFRPAPRQGHLDRLKRICKHLRNCKKTAIKFNTEIPDYSMCKVKKGDWGHLHHPCEEETPLDAPEPKGKPVRTTTFKDANLLHDCITGRSCAGLIHMVNKTPIEWYTKRMNGVETSTHGSEFVAARIGVDQIIDLRCTV